MEVYRGEKNHIITDQGDADSIIYQKGFSAGQEHTRPSPETLKKLAQMSEDITQLKVTNSRMETKLDNIIDTLKAHIEEESRYRTLQDQQHKEIIDAKADKWVQTFVIGAISTICLAVLGALLGLVIIK